MKLLEIGVVRGQTVEVATAGKGSLEVLVTDAERKKVIQRRLTLARISHSLEGEKGKIARTTGARIQPRVWPFDPHSRGQNGPALALKPDDHTDNERRVFMVFDPRVPKKVFTIKELAKHVFLSFNRDRAYYFVKKSTSSVGPRQASAQADQRAVHAEPAGAGVPTGPSLAHLDNLANVMFLRS